MSAHWRLAWRYAAWVSAGAVVLGAGIWALYGSVHAVAFVYGVAVGLISFVSTALTVSLITGSSTAGGVAVGAASFVARLGFAAGALGVPAYLELWPVVAMLVGFVAVYVSENVALLPGVLKVEPYAGGPAEGAERRVRT